MRIDDLRTQWVNLTDDIETLAKTRNTLNDSALPLIEDYTLEAIMTLTDEVLAGYRIQFNLPDRRTVYNCG